jgi:hypothetical protein
MKPMLLDKCHLVRLLARGSGLDHQRCRPKSFLSAVAIAFVLQSPIPCVDPWQSPFSLRIFCSRPQQAKSSTSSSLNPCRFGELDADAGWTKLLHLGALRNTNRRRLSEFGPDSGCDSIGDWPQADANLSAGLASCSRAVMKKRHHLDLALLALVSSPPITIRFAVAAF